MELKFTQTDRAPAAVGPFSQAVAAGGMLYISGQLPIDPATGKLAGDTIAEQARQSIANVGAILEANGTSFENVVKTTCYLADMADFAAFNEEYAKAFTKRPARACAAVRSLAMNALCEIEAIAVL